MKKIVVLIAVLLTPVFAYQTAQAVDVFGGKQGLCQKATDNADKTAAKDDTKEPSVCKDKDAGSGANNPIFGPDGIITSLINILSLITAIAAIIIIILAGLRYITSSTNPQDVSNARERIIYALVGLGVASLAQALVRFILGKTGVL